MKYLPLLWAGLWRKPLRTVFTFLSIVVAFLLFGLLQGLNAGYATMASAARLDRLFTDHRNGGDLPLSYLDQVRRVEGVTAAMGRSLLPGFIQERTNGVLVNAVDDQWFVVRPEMRASSQQIEEWSHTRDGAMIFEGLAKKFGTKVGDRIAVQTPVARTDGSTAWDFQVTAIVPDIQIVPSSVVLINYGYFDESRVANKGTINRIVIRVKESERATQVARAIDHSFANSSAPTRTQPESTNIQSGQQQIFDVRFFTNAVVGAVFFMLLFLTGNSMLQSARERIPEFAVLKTLGFTDGGVLALVLGEALLLCGAAAAMGLAIARLAAPFVGRAINFVFNLWNVPASTLLIGLVAALAVALISTLVPAWLVKRITIVDALAGRR